MQEVFEKGMPRFEKAMAPVEPGPLSPDRTIELISAAAADVSDAEKQGLFVPLPKTETGVSRDRSRIKTIRNRLFILGYLEKDTGRGNPDPALSEAIRAFQAEAGLEADGWVGEEETWPALQELVGFETPIDPSKWFEDGRPRPALRRAVALRLFVFGLLENRPDSPNPATETALATFGGIWNVLFADGPGTDASLTPEWIRLLFDMDGITRRLSQVKNTPGRDEMTRCHPFILNAAKVELWLMGYRVRPGGYDLVEKKRVDSGEKGELTGTDVFVRSATLSRYNKIKRNFLLYKALHAFWLDQGLDDDAADSRSVGFLTDFQPFFGIVDRGIRSAAAMDPAGREQNLAAFIRERKDQLPTIWDRVKRFGARIWDGVRRVWGWFVRMLRGVKSRVLEIGTNLSRLIYDFALGSFTVISRVFGSIGTVIGWIANPRLPGSDEAHILFYKDRDNDIFAVSHRQADPDLVSSCCRELETAAEKFSFGCQVIGAFVFLLQEAFRTAWRGYFGLVLALIRLRRVRYRLQELTEAYRQAYEAA